MESITSLHKKLLKTCKYCHIIYIPKNGNKTCANERCKYMYEQEAYKKLMLKVILTLISLLIICVSMLYTMSLFLK